MCQRTRISETTVLDEALYLNRGQKQFPVSFNIVALRTCEIYRGNETLKVNTVTLEEQIKESLLGLLISEL